MATPVMYAVAIEHCPDGNWLPLTEPYMQASERTPDEFAEDMAANWDLAELGHPWAVGVFKGGRFDEKLVDLRSA